MTEPERYKGVERVMASNGWPRAMAIAALSTSIVAQRPSPRRAGTTPLNGFLRCPGGMLLQALAFAFLVAATCAAEEPGICLVRAAKQQIGVTVSYDPSYRSIPYPNGDVPDDRGVCTDVLIRAYRSFGVDLQRLVHEDMTTSWPLYPKIWGLGRPDSNIDHRRVLNLAVFFSRHGLSLPVLDHPVGYAPGDLVTWRLPSGVPHIGMISDQRSQSGTPLVVHNIGRGTREEDVLLLFTITGHYRYVPESLTKVCSDIRTSEGVVPRR